MSYLLTESPLYALLLTGKKHNYPKGLVMYDDEDRSQLKLIESGYMKRYSIDTDGAKSIQVVYGPGSVFPLTPVFRTLYDFDLHSGEEVFHYEAIEATVVYSISQASLKQAIEKNPLLYKDLLYVSGMRLSSNIYRLENISLKTIHRRLAHMIVHYANLFGEEHPEGIRIALPLTHQTLADSLSVSRETITRRLIRLEEKGLIVVSKNILVKDLAKLIKES